MSRRVRTAGSIGSIDPLLVSAPLGQSNFSVDFDGVDGYAQANPADSNISDITDKLTVSVWSRLPASDSFNMLASSGISQGSQNSWGLQRVNFPGGVAPNNRFTPFI
ncbi:MAG: hypothetical protein ACXADH_13475, partial [Candidatus Kariarchaeaceae archaeon]